MQKAAVDQSPKVTRHAGGQRAVTNKKPHLDIAIESRFGEICGRHEQRPVIYHYGLRMKDARLSGVNYFFR